MAVGIVDFRQGGSCQVQVDERLGCPRISQNARIRHEKQHNWPMVWIIGIQAIFETVDQHLGHDEHYQSKNPVLDGQWAIPSKWLSDTRKIFR